jgi:hypothetical protein
MPCPLTDDRGSHKALSLSLKSFSKEFIADRSGEIQLCFQAIVMPPSTYTAGNEMPFLLRSTE